MTASKIGNVFSAISLGSIVHDRTSASHENKEQTTSNPSSHTTFASVSKLCRPIVCRSDSPLHATLRFSELCLRRIGSGPRRTILPSPARLKQTLVSRARLLLSASIPVQRNGWVPKFTYCSPLSRARGPSPSVYPQRRPLRPALSCRRDRGPERDLSTSSSA